MGTPGAGRKRTPVKDRFSAEDEALSHIAREAEARLAAKRAARAEARDIRMKELERQQKESSAYGNAQAARKKLSTSSNDILSGIYHDKRKYSTLSSSKSFSSSYTRPSSFYSAPIITTKSYRASLNDEGLHSRDWRYNSRTPTGSSFASQASSMYNSPWNSDDETLSTMSQDSQEHCDNVSPDFSDQSGSTAAYFSRSSRRGSVISDFDDLTVPDLSSLDEKAESFSRPASRNAVSGLSAATLASLGGPSSRRGSGDMSSILDPDVSLSEMRDIYELKDQIQDVEGRYMQGLKELKDSLSEVEEKYKKAMVSNAQLDNDKSNLIYQVDTLKDVIEEMEEQMAELYRENEEKSKELERQKHMYHVSQHKVEELKEGIRQRDELIEALERQKDYFDCIRNERDELRDELADLRERTKKHGLVIIPESTPNGDINHEPVVGAITVVSQEAAHVLEGAGDGPLDVRLKKLADEKEELLAQIRKLKLQLEEERQKSSKIENVLTDSDRLENGTDLQILEMQRDANRQLSEYKFKLSKAEQDIATVEQNVARLEGQLHRYKTATENSEKIEDELKAEKRRLQRELRLALDKNEEMEMTNSHLVKRLEKMKANRNALLSQQ
ncbi:leucine-rich repeat flightless-interacting protein 2 isoform X9 [Rhinoraja longicauda]